MSEAIHQEQLARGSSYHQSQRLIELKKKGSSELEKYIKYYFTTLLVGLL